MKVAIDVSPLKSGHRNRGVGFYTSNLINGLKKIEGLEVSEFTDLSETLDAEVIHYPYFDFYFRSLTPVIKKPVVVTVHDATPLVFKEHYPPGLKAKINLFWQKRALKKCQAVITVSKNAKEDINKYLNIPNSRIHVVYSAPADHFKVIHDQKILSEVSKKYNLPKEFAIYVGNVNWNKNINNTAQACVDAGVDLVIVGSAFQNRDNLDHPEMKSFNDFLKRFEKDPKIHCVGFVEDDELVALYNLATVTMFVSNYEGFGFPILESQVCGTPVITSNCSSMPEVAGDSAVLVDPYDLQMITRSLKSLLENNALRQDYIDKGYRNIKRFSWDKTAKQVNSVYTKII